MVSHNPIDDCDVIVMCDLLLHPLINMGTNTINEFLRNIDRWIFSYTIEDMTPSVSRWWQNKRKLGRHSKLFKMWDVCDNKNESFTCQIHTFVLSTLWRDDMNAYNACRKLQNEKSMQTHVCLTPLERSTRTHFEQM